MSRAYRRIWAVSILGLALSASPGVGCFGGEEAEVVEKTGDIPLEMLERSWPIRFSTQEAQNRLLSTSEGWKSLVIDRQLRSAVEQLGRVGGLPAARAHLEASALYRQAALLAVQALVQTYGVTPQDTDPAGVQHLLASSYGMLGQADKAVASEAQLTDASDPTMPWNTPWKAALSAGHWPPNFEGLPIHLLEPKLGEWPELEGLPHYRLREQGVDTELEMADPSALLALAFWHEAAAKAAIPDTIGLIDMTLARYRLPAEKAMLSSAISMDLPEEFLFGSDFLVPEDGAFVAALMGTDGALAVEQHAGKSLLANLALQARVDGKLDPEKALDLASMLRTRLIELSLTKSGAEDTSHRTFADISQVGALRILALVAEVEGNREASGILRIHAMEKSVDAAGCPNGLLSLAAWDAENRYPQRGLEILHSLIRRYPSLEIARYALDVLALRVSREGAKLPPGM